MDPIKPQRPSRNRLGDETLYEEVLASLTGSPEAEPDPTDDRPAFPDEEEAG